MLCVQEDKGGDEESSRPLLGNEIDNDAAGGRETTRDTPAVQFAVAYVPISVALIAGVTHAIVLTLAGCVARHGEVQTRSVAYVVILK